MDDVDNLNHSRWECKYHVVFIPKCRWKVLYGQLQPYLGVRFHSARQESEAMPSGLG